MGEGPPGRGNCVNEGIRDEEALTVGMELVKGF